MKLFRNHVLVCAGTGCTASGTERVKKALIEEIKKHNLEDEVKVVETGCFGFCRFGPNMVVYPEGVFYTRVKPEDVPELVEEHLLKGRIVERLLFKEPDTTKITATTDDIKFFKKQTRIALRNCGHINPESIEEAIARDVYFGLGKVLTEMTPEQVIEEVLKSGLRGRGGGGFPTGLKWKFAAKEEADQKYIVCNADEGDPGAFMDRSILEGDPHSVIEGMAIAGYAIGATKGYIYCRAEYPLAIKRVKKAIEDARKLGLLGFNLFGSGFDFDIEVRLGAGAFVCGEETALLNSIEGKRGEPRPKPPYPASSGLWGKPTIINNVETLANLGTIIRKGWEWFRSIGTEKSPGTKVFALAGKIKNNGLVEVPMGTRLGEVIFDIGGGIPNGKKFKAAQTGGPSGGCIPIEHLNVPIDYDSLIELGTMMGSGGLIVMDEDTCMVDLAKFFLEFVKDESCGKCTACRIGITRMLEILDRITKGKGKMEDIDLLIELGEDIKASALCGLGQTAPNPVLSTIRYFRDEYESHIKNHYCPASVCATLFNSPCQNACPANVDIPIYIDLIRKGKYREAYEVIREENPLPVTCGRVCNHPCEGKCNRGKMDDPIAIRSLKRFVTDYVLENEGRLPIPEVAPPNGKKVAIVGSGPAGLTCAFYLARKGYEVTIFEAMPVLGGMLVVGIPEYRLPKKLLNEEIKVIEEMGVKVKTNTRIGEDITIDELKKQGFDAIFIAVGAHLERNMNIEGEELEGCMSGTAFLRDLNLGKEYSFEGKKVVVVGGGNVAIDAARSSVRLGAEEVTIVYRRDKKDMPAIPQEIEEAEHEKIKIVTMVNPVRIIGKDGKVTAVECIKMRGGEFDKSGRRKPVPIEGSNYTMPADIVITAIGQEVDMTFNTDDLVKTERGKVLTDEKTMTNIEGIFAGGDCVTGPDTVVNAIKVGKKAASAIDKYLGGDGVIVKDQDVIRRVDYPLLDNECPREPMPLLGDNERLNGFAEVEMGYGLETALKEAGRCLRCDVKDK
ncbi:NADH-quinone oxidoreductase subunit NuoF [Anoxybacter fermentans]|uniref:NADH-quinone oxidoreductase subunit NuoF n=1 Tax=Anoxybacter fermentans TaxID=1323375 RepID=UPI0026C144A5